VPQSIDYEEFSRPDAIQTRIRQKIAGNPTNDSALKRSDSLAATMATRHQEDPTRT